MTRSLNRRTSFAVVFAMTALLLVSSAGMLAQSVHAAAAVQDAAERDYRSANGLLNRGMYELAVSEYRRYLREHPTHEKIAVARYGLGVSLYRLKRFDEAVGELEQIGDLEGFEFAPETLFVLGQCHLELRAYQRAADVFTIVLQRYAQHELADDAAVLLIEALYRSEAFKNAADVAEVLIERWADSPHQERAMFLQGLSLMAMDNFADAAAAFALMRETFPDSHLRPRTTLLLAQCLHRSNQPESAIAQYHEVLKQNVEEYVPDALYGLAILHLQSKPEQAAQWLDQLIERFSTHRLISPALVIRGRLAFDQGQYDLAMEWFQQAADMGGAQQDEIAYWMAKCDLRQDKHALAVSRLETVMREHPASSLLPEIMYDRAVALMRLGEASASADVLDTFLLNFADHALAPDALYLQAMLEHQQQQFEESSRLCSSFLKRHAGYALEPAVQFLAAENDFLSDHLSEAADKYRQFLVSHSDHELAANARYRLGATLYRLQDYNQAEPLLAAVIAKDDASEQYRHALHMLGDVHFQQAEWRDAAEFLAEYLSFGFDQPFSDDALLKLGLAQLRMGKSDEALRQFVELTERFVHSVHRAQAFFEKGQILLSQGQFDEAVAAFQQVVAESPKSRFAPYALNHLGSILMQQQQYAEAVECFKQAAEASDDQHLCSEALFQQAQAMMAMRDYAYARAIFDFLIETHPGHARIPQAQAHRALALARDDNKAASVDAVDAVHSVLREHGASLEAPLLAALGYEKARFLRKLGRTDQAVHAYHEMIAAYPHEPVVAYAMLELAELEAELTHYDAAIGLLTQLQERDSRSKETREVCIPGNIRERALYQLAICKFEQQHYDRAIVLCEQFLEEYPQSELAPSTHLVAGESLFKLEKYQSAIEHFTAVIEHHAPDDYHDNGDGSAYGASLLRRGECYAMLGQWAQSERDFARCLDRVTENRLRLHAHFGIGWAQENQQRYEEAIASYRSVIEQHDGPTAARAQFQIGECLFAQKHYNDAVRELLRVDILYAYPEWSAAAMYEAGRCFEAMSKINEARNQFEQVKQRFPESQWASMASQRLAAIDERSLTR